MDYKIQPLTVQDVSAIARIWIEGFKGDRQTQLKELGGISYTKEKGATEILRGGLRNTKAVYIKAVSSTDEILGFASYVFHGFLQEEIPRTDPGLDQAEPESKDQNRATEPKTPEMLRFQDATERLEAMENEDMKRWQAILTPPGSKCIIISGLDVMPKHQHKGIGSALLKWATALADRHQVYMWVHSSEAAFRAYLGSGFRVIGTLDVDLDAWAPEPPKDEGEASIWGHYLIRYMKRLPA